MKSEHALLLWLAASRFSNREIENFLSSLDGGGHKTAYELIRGMRDGESYVGRIAVQKDQRSSRDDWRVAEHASMIKSVEQWLLIEARLSKSEATKILMSELKGVPNTYGYLSSPNKISFKSWLARLGEDVSDSVILHVASKVRNEIVHGSRSVSDWPI